MSSQLRSASQDTLHSPRVKTSRKHSKSTRANIEYWYDSVPYVLPRQSSSIGRVEKVTLSKSSSKKKSLTFEEIFFEDQVGELTMDCNCIMNAGNGHLSGKMFITPTHLCFTSFSNPFGKKHKVIMTGDNIIAFKITEEKRRMNITAQKNTEKTYHFKKLDKEFLSMMIKWLQKFTCIDISENKTEGESREHSTENRTSFYNSSSRNSSTQDNIDTTEPIIRVSNDLVHSESSIEESSLSHSYHQEMKKVEQDVESKENYLESILIYIDNEIENFLALLETQTDPLYR